MEMTVVATVLSSVLVGLPIPARQAQGGSMPQVVCIGTACGGGGGLGNPCSSSSEYCYRVKPNGNPITSFEVSVEDGDISHYSLFCAPPGWNASILTTSRPHDVCSTPHGQVTSSASDCEFVLRFHSSTPRSTTFEVGYQYDPPEDGFHDVTWRTSNETESMWNYAVGTNKGPVHSPVPSRKNVLVIVLDDVGVDKLSLYDGSQAPPYALTPKLDSLAANGIKFTNFNSYPLCSIARACFQTGRYPFRTGMGWNAGTYELPDQEVLLAELLRYGFASSADSYRCGAFGKWHLAFIDPYPADDPRQHAPEHAVDNGYHRFSGSVANVSLDGGDHFNWTKVEHEEGSPWTYSNPPVTTWSADVARADAVSWINQQAGPFFAYVAFNPPHVPQQVPPTFTQDGRPLLSPATEGDLAGFPPGTWANPNIPGQRELFYRAALEAVDSEIKYLLDDICPVQKANLTVFVVGDNGTPSEVINSPPHNADHHKGTVYQGGVRVPLIVSGPLVPPGAHVCDRPVGAVDLWRTIAEITGADPATALLHFGLPPEPTYRIDSRSFLPLIQNPSGPATSPRVFSQIFMPLGAYASVFDLDTHNRSITDGEFKYIRKLNDDPSTPTVLEYDHEFYNIANDPEENDDLLLGGVGPPVWPTIYQELRNALEALSEF